MLGLPTYLWNHESRYWHESRIATNRHRPFPRNALIGTMTENCSDIEPVWRHVFRAENLPWLRDHTLHSAILYPMAGYICMALEATSQRTVLRETTFSKLVSREFTISRPLIIEGSTNVEMTITFRPLAEGTTYSFEIWDEFRIFSWEKDKNSNIAGESSFCKTSQNPIPSLERCKARSTKKNWCKDYLPS